MNETADTAAPVPTAAVEHAKPLHHEPKTLEFRSRPGLVLPHKERGRYWHDGSRHVVPADEAAALLKQPGFREVLHG